MKQRLALRKIQGAPSWGFASDCVEASLAQHGGQLAPVRFYTSRGVIQPFAIAPWAEEKLPRHLPPVLKSLRGDFFCAPFGRNDQPWRGEKHPVHGETASRRWQFVSHRANNDYTELVAAMRPKVRRGEVIKTITLRRGETNVYCRHELRGFRGPLTLGHHALLQFEPQSGPGQVSLSPWHHGQVCPVPFESPKAGGYSTLQTGAKFTRLERVPMANGQTADLTRYPAREGFDDLVMVSARAAKRPLAWTCVNFPAAGWLWFALKDPRTLASTLLWHSNGGRHYPPWNGTHRRVLGLEEITGYFDFGLAASVATNPLARAGVRTHLTLQRDRPLVVNYVMGVVALPPSFQRLKSVRLAKNHLIAQSSSGAIVRHPVDLSFFHPNP